MSKKDKGIKDENIWYCIWKKSHVRIIPNNLKIHILQQLWDHGTFKVSL